MVLFSHDDVVMLAVMTEDAEEGCGDGGNIAEYIVDSSSTNCIRIPHSGHPSFYKIRTTHILMAQN